MRKNLRMRLASSIIDSAATANASSRREYKSMDNTEILERVKTILADTFGHRLRLVVHYGSDARGEAGIDSDVDFLIVLEGPVRLGDDLDTIVRALYPFQLQIDRPIHALPVDEADYLAGEFGLYRHAKRDGVTL